MGGRDRPDPVHAIGLSEIRGQRRRGRRGFPFQQRQVPRLRRGRRAFVRGLDRLGSERLLALLSTTHPAAAAASVELARLGDLPLLIWSRSQAPAYYDELLRICRERGLEPQLVTAPPRITGVRSYLIADGRTFSLIPESATLRLSPGVCARPLSVPATVPVAATWRQSATARPELRTVLVLLRAAVREFAVS